MDTHHAVSVLLWPLKWYPTWESHRLKSKIHIISLQRALWFTCGFVLGQRDADSDYFILVPCPQLLALCCRPDLFFLVHWLWFTEDQLPLHVTAMVGLCVFVWSVDPDSTIKLTDQIQECSVQKIGMALKKPQYYLCQIWRLCSQIGELPEGYLRMN